MRLALLFGILAIGGVASATEPSMATPGRNQPPTLPPLGQNEPGKPVYPESACIGPVVNGVCEGTIQSTDPKPKRCYGEMLNGRCTGPMF
jgi:hypothetical protein